MILRQFFAMFVACAIGAVSAVEAPLIRHDETAPAVTVPETGDFTRIDSPGVDNRADTPRGVAAARVAVDDLLFRWIPSAAPGRITGGADLADAALSPDESLLAIAERVGGRELNSCRIVLFNLYNNRIVNGFTLDGVKPVAIRFLSSGTRLLVAEAAQSALGRKARFLICDLETGRIVSRSPELPADVCSVVAGDGKIWYTLENADYFHQLPADRLDSEPLAMRTLVKTPRLLLSPDGGAIALYGPGRVEVYNVKGARPVLVESLKLHGGFNPEWGALVADDGRMLVRAQEGGPAVLVGGGAVRPLAENAGPTGCYLPAERKFLLAVEYKDAVNLYQLPQNTRPESSVSPGRLKPENRNSIYRLLPRSGGESPEAVLIDHRGNVSLLRILPRRWRKQPVYEVPEG